MRNTIYLGHKDSCDNNTENYFVRVEPPNLRLIAKQTIKEKQLEQTFVSTD